MAAAEVRAAWQRAANRCFVQEDAKRAPKLACCQSSTSSSKQIDVGPTNFADCPDHSNVGLMPSNRTPSYSNMPPDAKWWLQMQPNYGYRRDLNFEQFNATTADVELESSPHVNMNTDCKVREIAITSEESISNVDYEEFECFLDVKKYPQLKLEAMNVSDGKVDRDSFDLMNMTEYYEFLEMETGGSSASKRTNNDDSSWIGGEKVPWWRVTDGEELASFVAQKSFHHIENCDLPPPQRMNVRREPYKQASSIDHDEILMSTLDWEAQSEAIFSPSYGGSQTKDWFSVKGGLSEHENLATETLRTNDDRPEKSRTSISDPSRAKLLEALRHSQTRAREAEKAVREAYTVKEDILKLFFRQASQLFAYKQWFKLLQLETFLLRTKDGDSSPLTAFPDLLPWMPLKPRKLHKKSGKVKGCKRGYSKGNEIGKYAIAFAVGFTLVGAGLILGWTAGWLLPGF